VIQCPDFAADALEVRENVIAGGFSTVQGPDGFPYTGISQYQVPHWIEKIAELRGPINPGLSGFRLNLAGELPHSWVHSDGICAKWASVLYLNLPEQCLGGTAFWKHKICGYTKLPSREALEDAGIDAARFYQWMQGQWKIKDAWEQIDLIPMRFNLFVTYPTDLFHSRFPFEAFGSNGQDGRLIWVCFYDLKESA
jgi:hypothetical protein